VSADEDLEEILGRVRPELLHAEIFQDQQVDPRELLDEIAARPGGLGLREVGGQVEGAAHERPAPGPDGADGDRGGDVRFAHTRRADQQHAAVVRDEPRARQFDEFRFRDLGIEAPVEIGQGLLGGDARLFEPARVESIGTARELVLDEQFEKLEMRQRGGVGLRETAGERVDHPGEPEMAESGRQLRIHERKSSRV
jgi:hypothetical protein